MNTSVKIGNTEFTNPILTASGTFGYGKEFAPFMNLDAIGGFCTKGISINPRKGNPEPRICETSSGMLNSIGLENCGSAHFLETILPEIAGYKTRIIVNMYAQSVEEFKTLTEILDAEKRIDCYELNLSCPNVKSGGISFGTDPKIVEEVTSTVRKTTDKTVIVKLSPNVTDITIPAKAAENGGADAVSLINTLAGLEVDVKKKQFALGNIIGGLSGAAIKPVALKLVWQTAKAVKIPVIGMGGISKLDDVLSFLMVGAAAIQIGAANFINPSISEELAVELKSYLQSENKTLQDITGILL